MPSLVNLKIELRKKLYQYEGKFNHFYLDTKGNVTIGVGHLVPKRNAVSALILYKTKNNKSAQVATLQEKQTEYDNIVKLPWGQRYGASSFKSYTTLVMKEHDINLLLDKHIGSFYKELVRIYSKTAGYADNFDSLHKDLKLALFDMILNLGASRLVNIFPKFNAALKAGDWKTAATESNRPDVSLNRNQYVKHLLLSISTKQKP